MKNSSILPRKMPEASHSEDFINPPGRMEGYNLQFIILSQNLILATNWDKIELFKNLPEDY